MKPSWTFVLASASALALVLLACGERERTAAPIPRVGGPPPPSREEPQAAPPARARDREEVRARLEEVARRVREAAPAAEGEPLEDAPDPVSEDGD